jgi:4-hydroxybenzoate polyprenyltransferase
MSTIEPHYLKKSIKIFRFYGIGLLISMLTVTLLRSVNENFKIVYEAFVAIPYLVTLVLAPLGLYYSWRAYKGREEPRKKRTMFLMGHLLFCILMILLFAVVIKDLTSLSW